MALRTAGTPATTTLNAIQWSPTMSQLDIAAFNALCDDDVNVAHPPAYGSFTLQGLLYVPNRSAITLRPGDWVVVDSLTGMPFVLSNRTMSSASWVHS
jgi:hypothetical protein